MSKYFRHCLKKGLFDGFEGLDSNRLTLVYFCVSGLDLLSDLNDGESRQVLAWVRRAQIQQASESSGFRGSTFFVAGSNDESFWDVGHIAMTYTGLAILQICGSTVTALERSRILEHARRLQLKDGGFKCHAHENDSDLRYLFRDSSHWHRR